MKIDFIHIGMHKTASSYLQKEVFPNVRGLKIINQELDSWFYDNFIKINAHKFDSDVFLEKFFQKVVRSDDGKNVVAISEENLSGDIYSGRSSKELMHRIKCCFDDTHILIVLRNPVDYILSTYSNYIVHGGVKPIKDWLFEQETGFGEILEKLHYSYMVNNYISTFGKDKVFVVFYENMFESKTGVPYFLKMFGLKDVDFVSKKVNLGRSLLANRFFAILNFFQIYKIRGVKRIFKYFPPKTTDREQVKNLLSRHRETLNHDSVELSKLLNTSLPDEYYL